MKTRNFVLVGLLALAFVLTPVLTHAQTIQQLLDLIAKLQAQLNALPAQQNAGCAPGAPFDPVSDARCSNDTAGCPWGSYYNSLTGNRCSDAITGCAGGPVGYNVLTGLKCTWPPPTPPTPSPQTALTVAYPNGGENWYVGQTYTIRWNTNVLFPINQTNYVQIALRDENYPIGSPYSQETLVFRMQNSGSYTFVLPASLNSLSGGKLNGNKYRVIIYPLDVNYLPDQSDAPFSIISTSTPSTNLPPSISGVSGPTTVNVGQSGTWSVQASDPENGPLSYSVVWGDETMASGGGGGSGGPAAVQQTATFTHTYSRAGAFTPTFTVTDNAGQSARTSLSVVVGGTITNNPPKFNFPAPTSVIGLTLDFSLSATDIDNDKLLYGFSFGDGMGIGIVAPPNCSNGFVSGQPFPIRYTYTNAGEYKLRATVIDCRGGQDTREWTVLIGGTPTTTPTITSSYPPNGAIDARGLRYSNDAGWGTLVVTFSSAYPGDGPFISDFEIKSTSPSNLSISRVRPSSEEPSNRIKFEVGMSRGMSPGERITITHKPSGSSICLGFLPGDVSQNGYFTSTDVGGLRSWLPTATSPGAGASQPDYKKDINRDGVFDVNDVTRASELLADTNLPKSLPACPPPALGFGGPNSNQSQLAATLASLTSLLRTLEQSLGR